MGYTAMPSLYAEMPGSLSLDDRLILSRFGPPAPSPCSCHPSQPCQCQRPGYSQVNPTNPGTNLCVPSSAPPGLLQEGSWDGIQIARPDIPHYSSVPSGYGPQGHNYNPPHQQPRNIFALIAIPQQQQQQEQGFRHLNGHAAADRRILQPQGQDVGRGHRSVDPFAPDGSLERVRLVPPPQASLLPSDGGWGAASFQPSNAGGRGIVGLLDPLFQQLPHQQQSGQPPSSSSENLVNNRYHKSQDQGSDGAMFHQTTSWPARGEAFAEAPLLGSVPLPPAPSAAQLPQGSQAAASSSAPNGGALGSRNDTVTACTQPACLEISEAYERLAQLLKVKDQMIWQLIQERNDLAARLGGAVPPLQPATLDG